MALATTGNVSCSIAWTHRDTNENESGATAIILTDLGEVKVDEDLTNGSGSQQVNQIFHEVTTLAGSATQIYNFQELTMNVFGSILDVSFSGGSIRGIIVKNTSISPGQNLRIMATGADGFVAPFAGGSGGLIVGPKSPGVLSNIMDGWLVSTNRKKIQIVNESGSGLTYSIAIIGTSG